eukprot:CAMPEP_0116889884 /NCGR_PEP_ID=MMETSP0467-20121206/441_1 /TAXON_ID=283647 /ORGANISM="Mesodinium pulex, Strain SPMC105" /LENGTH=57 /DNA_ID=CAMNT_0004557127 /DNA_START=418 /DNA_END=591 /DNA_ORIENTATION=+
MSSPLTDTRLIENLLELKNWIFDEYKALEAENNPENLEKMSELDNVIDALNENWVKK